MRGLFLLLLVAAAAGGLFLVLAPEPPTELARPEDQAAPAGDETGDDMSAGGPDRVRLDSERNSLDRTDDRPTVPVSMIVRDARTQKAILDFLYTIEDADADTVAIGEGAQSRRVDLPSGTYTLFVRRGGFVPADPKTFSVPRGSPGIEVEQELSAVAATVLLRVMDQNSQRPITPFNVTVRTYVDGTTAPVTEYLPAQEDNPLTIHTGFDVRLELVVEAPGYTPGEPIEVRAGELSAADPHNVSAFLSANMEFSGVEFRLVDENSLPIDFLEVVTEKLLSTGEYATLWRRRSKNDTGVYRLPDLAPGQYRMKLRPTDESWVGTLHVPHIEELEITGNEHVIKPLVVRLGGTILLTVTDDLGNTIGEGVSLGLRYPDGEIRSSLWRSFVEGQPEDDEVPLTQDHLRAATPARLVDPVPAGGYVLELRRGAGPVTARPLQIVTGERTPIRVALDG